MWVDVTFLGFYPAGYTYHVPVPDEAAVGIGVLAVAPLRKRRLTGVITGIHSVLPPALQGKEMRPILAVPLKDPVISPEILGFYEWCAAYYRIPLGGILKSAVPLPKGLLKGETIQTMPEGQKAASLFERDGHSPCPDILNDADRSLNLSHFLGCKENWDTLLRWTDQGWVRWDYPGFRRYFTSEIPCYRVSPGEIRRLGPRGKEIFAFVAERGMVTASEVRDRYPRSSAVVNRLLKRRALEVVRREEDLTLPARFRDTSAPPPALSHEQLVVLASVRQALSESEPSPILLHGITGSGKTELYIQAIRETVRQGRSALVLVPEIILTPQLISRIRERLAVPVVSWHSRLTGREKWRQWLLLHRVTPAVVIGARSAVFVPVRNLGLIVVDEEHDPSYKQEEGLLYHARDVAIVRSRHQAIPSILGSATPSIESYHNVKTGKFRYSVITRRPTGQPLPPVEVIDARQEGIFPRPRTQGLMLSRPLREALRETCARGAQSLLFLNRRGYARVVTCARCGQALSCPRCSVSLILHQPTRHLRCHYCGYSRALPETCEVCGGPLLQMGGGTQRLEEEIRGIIPEARVARLDRDTVQKQRTYEAILARLQRGEIDILIGTQMIVKGHDYPGIVLMGVVMADHSLRFPDFRASERTFQLLTQASGRCGRGTLPGRVIVQTFSPDHYSIRYASRHDFIGFYEEEIRYRRELGYPPFTRLAVLRVSGPDQETVMSQSERLAGEGNRFIRKRRLSVSLLGPAPALLSRLKNRYRWQILLKGARSRDLHTAVEGILASPVTGRDREVRIQVEFDPVQLV